ncbi:hypothetical protein T492DRAFT_869841 [Pavlovales sp. CCMP2436]|nr:hypothetical protein T492DRAFT_869841 [Pavlovales sp. CCMP2436]|mmetsp:Transcript_16872/g.43111  ORF Transcript_16872/g.43111 Transcript_16872/m.43111 type:complete len:232 (-) Transcript_16872:45-740(-)
MAAYAAQADGMAAWVSASPSHRDTLFKLAQYMCKLVASLGGDRELLQIARAINDGRTLMRVFGLLDVLRSLRTTAAVAPTLALVQDCSLAVYHPIEAWYWLSSHAPRLAPGPPWLSRAISAVTLVYNACAAVRLSRRLSQLRKAARDTASTPGHSAAAIGREIALVRLQLRRLLLDSMILIHWALDHPTLRLRDWQVAAIGVLATSIGLNIQWRAHAHACEQASALRIKAE